MFTKVFWNRLNLEQLKAYGVTELIDGVDYREFAKSHTMGVGFELLAINNSNSRNTTSIQSVRNLIANSISKGVDNFDPALHLSRHLDSAKSLKYLFAALIVLKANEEYYLRQRLINSVDEPTALTVTRNNITLFEELFAQPSY